MRGDVSSASESIALGGHVWHPYRRALSFFKGGKVFGGMEVGPTQSYAAASAI
jgi:hypothetical protein